MEKTKNKEENQYTEEILQKKTVAELRDIIKEKGLRATSKMRKVDLISLILGEGEGSVLDDATKKLAERIKKELDEANKKLKVPVEVYPAITKNPPRMLEDDMLINSKLVRPGLIEAVFVIVDTESGHVIGHAGIYKIDKRIRKAEYGILIGTKNARGKGYGTIITNTISEYGFSVLGLHKIKALVLKENLPSYYMFKKCGYEDEGVLKDENFKNDRYYDVVIMSRFENV